MFNKNDPKVLPLKNGVKPSCVVLPSQGQGLALDFLCQRLPAVSRSDWLQRMAAHEVVDERGRPVTPETPFLTGLRIYYYRQTAHEPPMPFRAQVLYQDAHLVVADKPHFLPVTPGGSYIQHTLLVQLKNQLGLPDLSPIHRIDRDTAGLVLLSTQRSDRGAYQALFREQRVHKTYQAIAPYQPELGFPREHHSRMQESGHFIRMQEVAGPPNSHTRLTLLEHNTHWARYQLEPISGKPPTARTHGGPGHRHLGRWPLPRGERCTGRRLFPPAAAIGTSDYLHRPPNPATAPLSQPVHPGRIAARASSVRPADLARPACKCIKTRFLITK